jgi:hypothetical protein
MQKIQRLKTEPWTLTIEVLRLEMEPWRVYRPVVTHSHQFYDEQDPEQTQSVDTKIGT